MEYFLLASKSGGFRIHAWISFPSNERYRISSGSLCWMPLKRSSFTRVIDLGVAAAPPMETISMSPMFACVEIVAAMTVRFDVALYAITLWRPLVTGSTLRPAMSMRTRFALPRSADRTMRDDPSGDQRIGFGLWPGVAASPPP